MNKTQEALKMAIEAMEEGFGTLECEGMLPHRYQEAIQSCKEALEQQDQYKHILQSFDEMEKDKRAYYASKKQDIAKLNDEYLNETYVEGISEQQAQEPCGWYCDHDIHDEKVSEEALPLYTHPAKTLSDDEIINICVNFSERMNYGEENSFRYAIAECYWIEFARAIEKKVRGEYD